MEGFACVCRALHFYAEASEGSSTCHSALNGWSFQGSKPKRVQAGPLQTLSSAQGVVAFETTHAALAS